MRTAVELSSARTGDTSKDAVVPGQHACADHLAFDELYERHRERVYVYMRTRTRNAEDASDLTQQVFLQALDALPHYRGDSSAIGAWLFRIARNTAIDFHRRERNALAWDLLPEALHPLATDDVEAGAMYHDAVARLRTTVLALDRDAREVLALRFAARLPIKDIAAVVGKSEAAVKKRLVRTLRRLRECYDDSAR